jgi:predicted RND superfamily exporter protein
MQANTDGRTPSLIARSLAWLAGVQARAPWLPILACLGVAAVMSVFASRLELRTRFDQLLPDHQPSVVELRRVQKLTDSATNAYVVLEADDTRALRAMGDSLVPKLRAIGAPIVTSAEDGIQTPRAYLMPRAGLFAKLPDLEKLRDDIQERWDWEVGDKAGWKIDADEAPPPPITADTFKKRFGTDKSGDRFPDGYYQSKDGKTLIVIAHTAIPMGELERANDALAKIRAATDEVHAQFPSVKVSYAGDLVTSLIDYSSVKDDLLKVGALGIGLVLAVVFLFFMRVRALVAMGVTIGCGLAWTFGLTQLAIGHLNVATGFLVSIVAGNGINFGIIYLARYFEERRNGFAPRDAIARAHQGTWPQTLTAALAAAAAYGSLGITDFRAFKHFAFIGAIGMVVCWIATYAMLPAVLVLVERVAPFRGSNSTWLSRLRTFGIRYDAPFAAIVPRAPRVLAAVGAVAAIAGAVLVVRYVRSDPMEYDMRKIRSSAQSSNAATDRAVGLASDILGQELDGSMVILADRAEQIPALKKELEARRDAAPEDKKPFEAVHTLFDFVAEDQAAKLPVLMEIRDKLVRARDRGSISDADWEEIQKNMPPEDLAAYGIADLPAELARAFTERDGTRGRMALIEPTAGQTDSDLRYLMRWADSFRETKLSDGAVVRGSGRAVIFADMLKAVVHDMPRAIALSLLMTVLSVVVVFRRGGSTAVAIGALFVGLGWMTAYMALSFAKINFFNFVALPITFGIGVDYAVNFVARYDADRRIGILGVLKHTGGAVILCSLTTILGYLALLGSINQAIRSLGALAVLGEICCLLAAVLVLPAALVVVERQRARQAAAAPSFSGSPNSAIAPASPTSMTRPQYLVPTQSAGTSASPSGTEARMSSALDTNLRMNGTR